MLDLLRCLDVALREDDVRGELYLVGGAVMCLAFEARPSTRDVDGCFLPRDRVREAARRVGREKGVGEAWLNDAVKGFLSEGGTFDPFLDMANLKVFVARPEYMLAMKCLAMRLGPEFSDEDDVRYLLRNLGIESTVRALEIVTRYYPMERFPGKTLCALEEILGPRK